MEDNKMAKKEETVAKTEDKRVLTINTSKMDKNKKIQKSTRTKPF